MLSKRAGFLQIFRVSLAIVLFAILSLPLTVLAQQNALQLRMFVHASAHIAGLPSSSEHVPTDSSNLSYHGGPVMRQTSRAYLIFWEPPGSIVTPRYNDLMKQYFQDVGGSGLYHNNIQYPDYTGKGPTSAVLAATYLDSDPYPANPMSDLQLQEEISLVVQTQHWHASLHNVYFVYTAQDEQNSLANQYGYCAYHGYFGAYVIYAAMVYSTVHAGCLISPPSPNNDLLADSSINLTSHEQMESATDPLLNAWFGTGHYEIGDKCVWIFGPRDVRMGDIILNPKDGNEYVLQKEWDNKQSGCVLQGP